MAGEKTERAENLKPASGAGDRRARLAAELRQNLQRRKEQARSRRGGAADERGEGFGIVAPPAAREDGS